MNSRVSEVLFAVLRASLANINLKESLSIGLSAEDWRRFVVESQRHNVLPIVCDGLSVISGRIPRQVSLQIAGLTVAAEKKYDHRVAVIKDIANLLNQNGVPVMLLKGWGISLYYPNPSHRSFSDVDTYHFGKYREADNLIAEKLGVEVETDVHHHTTCVYKGVLIENHYDFINTTQHNSNKKFEAILKAEAEKQCTEYVIDGTTVLLPSAMFNALFLMRHMAMHYAAERVSVRHLCDWMQFVKAEYRNIDWQRVNRIYQEFNMKRFADAITGICIAKLGMEEGVVPDVCRDIDLENRIFNDILTPEFDVKRPSKGFVRIVWWKMKRYYSNRWKHKLIYSESWLKTFFQSSYSHLLKPKTITH